MPKINSASARPTTSDDQTTKNSDTIYRDDSKIRFKCPTCKAEPGQPCTYGSRAQHPHGMSAHARRLDLYIAWATREAMAAADAGYAGEDEPRTTADGGGTYPPEAAKRGTPRQCFSFLTPLGNVRRPHAGGC